MLSKPLTFFIGILTLLLIITFYFPGVVTAQSDVVELVNLPIQEFVPDGFVVYGKAPTQEEAGIMETVRYRQITDLLPNLEDFFEFGGTLELLTTNFSLSKHDIVISEIMWGLDTNYPTHGGTTYTQWIELYNTYPNGHIRTNLFLLFTPFKDYPDRDVVELPSGTEALVLDAVSNLHLGRWDLPGKSGRRPFGEVISAYRNITYANGANRHLRRARVPFGSYAASWKATPQHGRRNTLLRTVDDSDRVVELPYIATPGTQHVAELFLQPLPRTAVRADRVVINEIRNDVSRTDLDWVELKNVNHLSVNLENWELSIVTGVGEDIGLVDLPHYVLAPGEILLLQRRHPKSTVLADGIDIADLQRPARGAIHKFFVAPALHLPNTGKFVLLLRSETDKNGQDAAIEDYAGNGFFSNTSIAFDTEFWPRIGQPRPTEVADFGDEGSFGSLDSAWARLRYNVDDGHHEDAWEEIGSQGGIGYAPGVDLSISPGTPGYENNALKTRVNDENLRTPTTSNEYSSGEITISEIMLDAGPRRNKAQWIELYNSSLTEAVNLAGWELEVRNAVDDRNAYADGVLIFKEAIILPHQTLLLVSKSAPNNVIDNRIYNLHAQHRHELSLNGRRNLLNPTGFYLKLTAKGYPQRGTDDIVVDQAGNLGIDNDKTTILWDLPERDPTMRQPLVRQYGAPFKLNQRERDRIPDPAVDGMLPEAWRQADSSYVGITYYGDDHDRGTPGSRFGSPLPVQLSNFLPKRTAIGVVVISWTTESELDNAGFNLLRSEHRDGVFIVINPTLIQGTGTSGEKHSYRFTDTTAKPNVVYYYRIEDVSFAGVHQTLVTVRLRGHVSPNIKLLQIWGNVKSQE